MIIEDKNHINFLFRLLNKIKYCEIDEVELSDFVDSPYLNEIQKIVEPDFKKHFIDNNERLRDRFNEAKLEKRHSDLIINRVSNWNDSSRRAAKLWSDKEIEDYLIQTIGPLKYDIEQLNELTRNFKLVIQK